MAYGYPAYNPATGKCSGGPRPGAVALRGAVMEKFPLVFDLGIYNCRNVAGTNTPSVHGKGRAWDAGIRPQYRRWLGDQVAASLQAAAPALGLQEIIWWHRRWTSVTGTWKPYNGDSAHEDHVHTALNVDAGEHLTYAAARAALAGIAPPTPDPTPTPPTPAPAPPSIGDLMPIPVIATDTDTRGRPWTALLPGKLLRFADYDIGLPTIEEDPNARELQVPGWVFYGGHAAGLFDDLLRVTEYNGAPVAGAGSVLAFDRACAAAQQWCGLVTLPPDEVMMRLAAVQNLAESEARAEGRL